jgi:hypothetical protein
MFMMLMVFTARFVEEANTSMFEGEDLDGLKIVFEHSDVDVVQFVLHKQSFHPLNFSVFLFFLFFFLLFILDRF